ncbi:PREDICTED: centrosomal protein of 63 kDa-like [Nicotiana attenuata]|uniref:centrosomal protein of 63 kDa-like n=1 Tax=Nicotiana attenuata TaxID=49451 RepID=UPI000904CB0B|nr:PREDICTED: centrosomal protein of 63 kDa-like [Nicotiana attenuata]
MTLHREAFSKSRAKLTRCEAELKKLVEERDGLKLLYIQKEKEIMELRAKLTRAHREQTELIEQKGELVEQLREEATIKEAETLGRKQHMDRLASEKDTLRAQLTSIDCQLQSVKEESLALAQKIEELEAKLAVEHAKAKSEALVASYRVDAEGANIRAQEIYVGAEVKLSCAVDHARRQSHRETLEEEHARGFNLSADIESAKALEDEASALLSDDENSASGSQSARDEDEAPEEAAPEDVAPKVD